MRNLVPRELVGVVALVRDLEVAHLGVQAHVDGAAARSALVPGGDGRLVTALGGVQLVVDGERVVVRQGERSSDQGKVPC